MRSVVAERAVAFSADPPTIQKHSYAERSMEFDTDMLITGTSSLSPSFVIARYIADSIKMADKNL